MRRPIIPITISFILGILTFNYFPQYFSLDIIIMLFLVFLILTTTTFLISKYQYFYLTLFFIIGLLWGYVDNVHTSNLPNRTNITVSGVIDDISPTKSGNTKIILQIKGEKLLVILKGSANIKHSDIVSFSGKITAPSTYQNPGVCSYSDYLKRRGIYKIMFASSYKKIGEENINFIRKLVNITRSRMLNSFETLPSPHRELLGGLVLGSKASYLDKEIEDIFRRIGTVHVLVASGAQVSLLLILCFYIFYFNRIQYLPLKIIISFIIFAVIIFYALITAGDWPIIRAVIMGVILLLSVIMERDYDGLSSLFFAAFVIALFQPNSIFDVGWQLSFSVCFGIVYISPLIFNKLKTCPPSWGRAGVGDFQNFYYILAGILSITLSAQVMVLPIVAYYFHQLSVVSLLANVLTLPLIGLLLPAGLLSGLLGIISVKLSLVINIFLGGLLHFLLFASEKLNNIPFANITVFPPTIFEMLLYYSVVIAAVNYRYLQQKLKLKLPRLIIITLFAVLIFIFFEIFQKPDLKITFIDVGQGDSILIQMPKGKNILIDGGGTPASDFDIGEKVLLPLLRHYRIRKIDLIILTHPHIDHLEGLFTVLEKYKVGAVISNRQPHQEKLMERFMDIIEKKNINCVEVAAGDVLNLQSDLSLTILNPDKRVFVGSRSDIDNNSIVAKLKYKNVCFLFTADIYAEGEEKIGDNFPVQCEFLKVGHHGSKFSTTDKFLEKVKPNYAIISVGENNLWGHPHKEVIERLEEYNCRVFRTDEDGAVIVKTDGESGKITLWGRKEVVNVKQEEK